MIRDLGGKVGGGGDIIAGSGVGVKRRFYFPSHYLKSQYKTGKTEEKMT